MIQWFDNSVIKIVATEALIPALTEITENHS